MKQFHDRGWGAEAAAEIPGAYRRKAGVSPSRSSFGALGREAWDDGPAATWSLFRGDATSLSRFARISKGSCACRFVEPLEDDDPAVDDKLDDSNAVTSLHVCGRYRLR